MDATQAEIQRKLQETEQMQNMRVVHAVESGSRAWGFASADSDYDCRFIYVRPQSEYLVIYEKSDTIMEPIDAVYDINGWDIKKAIAHMVRSNVVMMEWLSSDIVYKTMPPLAQALRGLAHQFFSPVSAAYQYLSTAKKKFATILESDCAKIKHYCYVLRPLACVRYMQAHGKPPHMQFQRSFSQIDVPPDVRESVELLLDLKQNAQEGYALPQNHTLLTFFVDEIAALEAWARQLPKREQLDTAHADALFRHVLEEAWRDNAAS